MANERIIDHIDYEGNSYEFADGYLRNEVNSISVNVDSFKQTITERLNNEEKRAANAEAELMANKANISDVKMLAGFTDEDRAAISQIKVFNGATSTADGSKGIVPAPKIIEREMFLRGNGSWATPKDTTYGEATYSQAGLMSAVDKINLDYFNEYVDDDHSSTVDFEGNTITVKYGRLENGVIANPVKSRVMTFNNDGSITERIKVGSIPQRVIDITIANGKVTKKKRG